MQKLPLFFSRCGVVGAVILGYIILSVCSGSGARAAMRNNYLTQQPSSTEKQDSIETILVDYDADVMQNRGDGITRLIGNVHFHHNGSIIQCDSAYKYSGEKMEFFGNVVIEKDSALIYGDRVLYDGETNLADVFAPIVKMVRNKAVLYSYNLQFNTKTSIAYFHSGGVMFQGKNLMEAQRGYFEANGDYMRFLDSVALRNGQYVIKTDSIGFHIEQERVDFLTLTYIWDSDRDFLRAGGGHYFSATSTYLFTQDAYVMTPDNELWADTLRYLTDMKQAYLFNNVQILDTANSTVAFGQWGFFDDSVDRAILTQMPSIRVWEKDSTGRNDSSYMRADTILLITLPLDTLNKEGRKSAENFQAFSVTDNIENSAIPTSLDTMVEGRMSVDSSLMAVDSVTMDSIDRSPVVTIPEHLPLEGDSTTMDSLRIKALEESIPMWGVGQDDSIAVATDSLEITTTPPPMPIDSTTFDPLKVEQEEPKPDRLIRAYKKVKMWNTSYQGVCDSTVAYSVDSTASMFGSPILWSQNNQISSQRIDLYTKNQELDWADFSGEPFIAQKIFSDDTLYFNQAEGKRLEAYFKNDELDYTILSGNVKNIYYMDEMGKLSAFVMIESAELKMLFKDREPTRMIWKGSGEGPIYPIQNIPPTQSMLLEKFVWFPELRPKSANSISPNQEKASQRDKYSHLPQPIFSIHRDMEINKFKFTKEQGWRDRSEWPNVTSDYFLQRNDQLLF